MIYIYWAPPRQGKSYWATAEVVALLLEGKRTVYTNYPVVVKLKDGTYRASKIWTPDMAHKNIVSADIIIDEAYVDYSSREYKKFSVDLHTFFATNGHNDLNIILLAQNPARIDLIIREMCSSFHYIKKTAVPYWLWRPYAKIKNLLGGDVDPNRPRPLFFTQYVYLTEKDMAAVNGETAWQVNRLWFDHKVASSYDTHYYRNQGEIYQGVSWLTKFTMENSTLPATASAGGGGNAFPARLWKAHCTAMDCLSRRDLKGFLNVDV